VARDIRTIYVANLPWSVTEDDLAGLFAEHVPVAGCRVIQDKETGLSRGFGFVEVDGPEAVQKAVSCLDGCDCRGRKLLVTPAFPIPERR
jgi:RNA recognition motif-containing protein